MRFSPLFLVVFTALPLTTAFSQSAPQKMKATAKAPLAASKSAKKTVKKESPVDALWRKSDEAFHAGNYPLAVGFHRKIVALDPRDVESYSVASWLLWSLGKPDEALQFIADGLKANPKDPEMWDAAGQHYNLQKRASDAENAFGKAIQFGGKAAKSDMMLRRRYAHAAQDAGHLAKSIELWRALVADFPRDVVNQNNLRRVQKSARPGEGTSQTAALDWGFSGRA